MKRQLALALALASAPLGACGKEDPKPAPDAAQVSAPPPEERAQPRREPETGGTTARDAGAPAQEGKAPELPGPFATSALAVAPKAAPFVMVVNLQKVFDAVGLEALLSKYNMLLGPMAAPMVEMAGRNFFEPASWKAIGIDLGKPAGFFGIDKSTQGGVAFFALSDRAAFEAFVAEVAKKAEIPLTPEKLGDATLYTMSGADRSAVLVKGDALYAVTLFRGTGAAAIAKELLARKPEDSLGAATELGSALAGVVADEAGAFVRVGDLIEPPEMPANDAQEMLATMKEALAKAKADGNAQLAKEIETQLEVIQRESDRSQRRRRGEAELAAMFTKDLGVVALGLDLSPEGAELTVSAPMSGEAFLAKALQNGGDIQPILKVVAERPLLLAGGRADMAAWKQFLGATLAADGDDLGELTKELKEQSGIDLEGELFAALSGEVGIALTGDLLALMKVPDPSALIGGTFLLGVSNADAAKALLAKIGGIADLAERVKWDAGAGILEVSLPDDRKVSAQVAGSYLVISTDAAAAGRLGGGSAFVDGLGNAKAKAVLGRKDLAAVFAMPQTFGVGWLMLAGGRSMPPRGVGGDSAEAKAKREQLEKLQAEIDTLRAKVEEARMKPVLDAFGKLGLVSQTARRTDVGVAYTIGMYTDGATLAEAVSAVADVAIAASDESTPTPDEAKLRELEDQRWKLESELWNLESPKAIEEPETDKAP